MKLIFSFTKKRPSDPSPCIHLSVGHPKCTKHLQLHLGHHSQGFCCYCVDNKLLVVICPSKTEALFHLVQVVLMAHVPYKDQHIISHTTDVQY